MSLCPRERAQTETIYLVVLQEQIDLQEEKDKTLCDPNIPNVKYIQNHPLVMMSNSMFGKSTATKQKLRGLNMTLVSPNFVCLNLKISRSNTIFFSDKIKKLSQIVLKLKNYSITQGDSLIDYI